MILSFTSPLQATWIMPLMSYPSAWRLWGPRWGATRFGSIKARPSGVWCLELLALGGFPSLALGGVGAASDRTNVQSGVLPRFMDPIQRSEQPWLGGPLHPLGLHTQLCPFWTRRPSSLSLMLLWSHIWINEMLCTWECPWRAFRNFSWCRKLQHGVNEPMKISGASYLVHVNQYFVSCIGCLVFLCTIQGTGCTFKALHGLTQGYLRDSLSLQSVRSSRAGMLQVPLAKELQVGGVQEV